MGELEVTDNRSAARLERELRDPRGATQSMSWVNPGRPALPKWHAETAYEHGYYASFLVNRAINIIADRVSQLPFRAGTNLDDPSDYSQNAPLARLLGPPPGTPNPELSARTLWKHAILNYLVTGRFAWEIDLKAPTPLGVELWPLVIGGLQPVPTTTGRYYFAGFEYSVGGALEPVKYKREEVVYAWKPSPDDPREPESALRSLALNVSVLIQIDQYNYAFMKNDAKPATLVTHGPFSTDDAQEAWRRQFLGNHRGPLNANKTFFNAADPDENGNVAGTIDIKQIGASAKDSQLTQIYEQQLDAVTSGLGVPMSLMDASGRTFSNAGQEMQNFYELTILPLCADLQDHINRDLAPKVGSEVGWFDISKVEALKPQLSTGVTFGDVKSDMLLDERRSYAGLGPADVDSLMAEKADAVANAQAAFAGKADPTPAVDTQAEDPAPMPGPTTPPSLSPVPLPVPRARTRAEQIDDAVRASRPVAVARITSLLERQLEALRGKSERSITVRAEGKRGRQLIEKSENISSLYERSFWYEEIRQALEPVFHSALTAAASTLAGLAADPVEDLEWWVSKRASDLAYELVDARWTAMHVPAGDDLVDRVRVAHEGVGLTDVPVEVAATAYDEAVKQLSGVSRATVRDLLTRLTAGDVDLDRAMGELTA